MRRYFLLVALGTLILLASCSLFPESSPNTSVPNTPTETTSLGSATVAATGEEPLAAPSETPIPTTTSQPPSSTPTPTQTHTPGLPTSTPTVTATKPLVLKPSPTPHFLDVQLGSPIGLSNFAHPELGCQWQGVAGQVFDNEGLPLEDLVVEAGGTLAGQPIFSLAITGSAPIYGPGGFEIKLGDQPVESSGTVWLRVFDLQGTPLSSPVYFSTYSDCSQNLILLNFAQAFTLPTDWFYLPVIYVDKPNP